MGFLKIVMALFTASAACTVGAMNQRDYYQRINPGKQGETRPADPLVWRKAPPIALDLDSDGRFESVQWEKVDGLDIFSVHDAAKKTLWEKAVTPNGANSYLGKVELKEIFPGQRVLLFYYFEGEAAVPFYKRVGRLFTLSFALKGFANKPNFHFQWTPYLYGDHLLPAKTREKRDFHAELVDLTGNGICELLISQGELSRVMRWDTSAKEWVAVKEEFYRRPSWTNL